MPGERGTACLLVTNIFPPAMGGSSEVYAALASFAQGDIAVLTSSHDYETGLERQGWRAFDSQAPYPVHRVTCIRPYLRTSRLRPGLLYRIHEALTALRLAASVLRLALRYRVGAICIADDETVGWLTLAGRVLKVRTLIYCHGDDLKCVKDSVPRRRRWFGLADRVVAASHYAARLLIAEFGVPAGKVATIPNGVDLGAFSPQAVPPTFLQQHELEGHRLLLTVSRLVPRKGVDKVLEALPVVARQFPNLLYAVVGDGPQRRALEQKAQALGVAHMVRFFGAVAHTQTREFYNAAELVLLPNREEAGEVDGLPLVFLEANACAKPVIGGRAGGTPEIVRDGENGVLVDGNDPGAIAVALRDLLGNQEMRTAMGQRGFEMARDWSWAARAAAFLRLCRG